MPADKTIFSLQKVPMYTNFFQMLVLKSEDIVSSEYSHPAGGRLYPFPIPHEIVVALMCREGHT